ncbi:MAG: Gfo/Idh/MocA family oxidoreductase, partial [Actinomycetota bacterium]|nr:Gfo/Idh/MocA family oxidoreductase [Actinomycetota bacterium]
MGAERSIALAIVGLGYWGPNLLRNAWDIEGSHVVAVCDRDAAALDLHGRRYPSVKVTQHYEEVLADENIDAVLIATPVRMHHAMARDALNAGKHVFVEKPMGQS